MSSWQTYVFERLNIDRHGKYIVIDHIGLLGGPAFKSFLSEKQIKFSFATEVQEILDNIKSVQIVIVKPGLDLPAYLEHQVTIIHFDIQLLPISINPDVLSGLSLSELAMLIEYINDAGVLQLIEKTNCQEYLSEARLYSFQNELKETREELHQKCNAIQTYSDLLELGELWGRYVFMCFKVGMPPEDDIVSLLDRSTEQLILKGIVRNAFYEQFKTVDKIVSHIQRQKPEKFALVCFDAMGIAEWHLLKEYLLGCDFQYREVALFALIPTMTLISRSAIFYGNAESVYELKSSNEDKAFSENFLNYTVCSFREGELSDQEQLLGIDAVKIIYNVFDELAHKTILPPGEKSKGIYFKNVVNYLKKSRISEELKLLVSSGFRVWFCSDHGTVVATGNGIKVDKYLMETSCRRATIIEKSDLARFYDVNQYEIPFVKNKIALLAKDRTSFSYKNKVEITHGGITLDELVVPFVEVAP